MRNTEIEEVKIKLRGIRTNENWGLAESVIDSIVEVFKDQVRPLEVTNGRLTTEVSRLQKMLNNYWRRQP